SVPVDISRRRAKSGADSSYLDSNALKELGGSFSADHREHVVVRNPCLLCFRSHVDEHDFVFANLFDLCAEEHFDLTGVDAIIDVHLVAKLQVAFEVAADHQRYFIVSSERTSIRA